MRRSVPGLSAMLTAFSHFAGVMSASPARTLVGYATRVLTSPDPREKVRLTNEAAAVWQDKASRMLGGPLGAAALPEQPSRPALPHIVGPGDMPSPRDVAADGISHPIYVLHSLAHVELNAIDLAWDTAIRFGEGMGQSWFDDFLSIAVDESRHFGWLTARLEALGSFYGALPAHRIVWDAADVSKTSKVERLALGQLCQEARGLDAGPKLAERLVGLGDNSSASIVRKIAEEEVAHVRIGVRWFLDECGRIGKEDDAVSMFHEIALRLSNPGAFTPPFNVERRKDAGLDPEWYLPVAEEMKAMVQSRRKKKPVSPAVPSQQIT